MDPFAQQIQRIENNDKVRELVEAFRLIPIADVNARNQLHESLEKILTPAAQKNTRNTEKNHRIHIQRTRTLVPRNSSQTEI